MSLTSVRLPPELSARLDELTERLQRTRSWVINEAVREYVVRADDEQERWGQTLAALESVKAGRLIDGESVDRWLDGWGKTSPTKRSTKNKPRARRP